MSFGSRFSRKRLPCCVLGFLQEKLNFRIYKTILIFYYNKNSIFKLIDVFWLNYCLNIHIDHNVLHVTLLQ